MALYSRLTSAGFVLVSCLTFPSYTWALLVFLWHDELTHTQEFFYLWLVEHSILLATRFSLDLKTCLSHGHVLLVVLFFMDSRKNPAKIHFLEPRNDPQKIFLFFLKPICFPNAFHMHVMCILNAFWMHALCTWNALFKKTCILGEKTCISDEKTGIFYENHFWKVQISAYKKEMKFI